MLTVGYLNRIIIPSSSTVIITHRNVQYCPFTLGCEWSLAGANGVARRLNGETAGANEKTAGVNGYRLW